MEFDLTTDHLLEICVENLDGVLAAAEGGADRIELCAALAVGGLTPSVGTISRARAATTLPIMTMIRPRPGDFVYDDEELAAMELDIAVARDLGSDGVVFGALTEDGTIDRPAVDRLVAAADSLDITFHRAFDVAADHEIALEALIDAGVPRLLTSGGAPSAQTGVDVLRSLVEKAAGRLIVMPGSGLGPDNVAALATSTGARELHASASCERRHERAFEGERITDDESIRRMREALAGA